MSYLLAGQPSETERLQLQSVVWAPAGQRLLDRLGDGTGRRVVDVGCGALGWLGLLSGWVGPTGACTGTDISGDLLDRAGEYAAAEGLSNVTVVEDDLFDSRLQARAYDLVHARFQIAPLGRAAEQVAAYRRLLRPGGILVLEDPDSATWTYAPHAPCTQELVGLIRDAFRVAGGDFDAGRNAVPLLTEAGLRPAPRTERVELPAGHPYLALPLQFAASMRPRLEQLLSTGELDRLLTGSAAELSRPETSGVTFTLVQTWAAVP